MKLRHKKPYRCRHCGRRFYKADPRVEEIQSEDEDYEDEDE